MQEFPLQAPLIPTFSAMLLALKSLLFFCLDINILNLELVEFQTAKGK